MRSTLVLLASASLVLLAAPVATALPSAPVAEGPSCIGEACEAINAVCMKAFGVRCVGLAGPVHCMGEVCDAGNAVCYILLKAHCLG